MQSFNHVQSENLYINMCVCVQHAFLFMPIPYLYLQRRPVVPRCSAACAAEAKARSEPWFAIDRGTPFFEGSYSHTESTVNARIWLRGAKKYEKKDEVAGSSKDKKDKKDHKEKENTTKRKREKSPAPDAENKPGREKKMKKSKKWYVYIHADVYRVGLFLTIPDNM